MYFFGYFFELAEYFLFFLSFFEDVELVELSDFFGYPAGHLGFCAFDVGYYFYVLVEELLFVSEDVFRLEFLFGGRSAMRTYA